MHDRQQLTSGNDAIADSICSSFRVASCRTKSASLETATTYSNGILCLRWLSVTFGLVAAKDSAGMLGKAVHKLHCTTKYLAQSDPRCGVISVPPSQRGAPRDTPDVRSRGLQLFLGMSASRGRGDLVNANILKDFRARFDSDLAPTQQLTPE